MTGGSGEAVVATSIEKGLTAYDAQFVVTAMALEVPLITSDRRMLAAAPDVAIHPGEFIERMR